MTRRPPTISLVVHALDRNPIVRAAPVAYALQRIGFDIEVVGMLDQQRGLYAPYANAFPYKTASSIKEVASKISGDAVYSFKPLPTTLLPAMLSSRFGKSMPVLLDVEDDDYGVCGRKRVTRVLKGIRDAGRFPYGHLNPATHALRRRCDAITVSTSLLQTFYGGSKILHGPDELAFDPQRVGISKHQARREFGLPEGRQMVLFAGRASQHKGFEEIVSAVEMTSSELVLAGDPSSELFSSAVARLGKRCHPIGMVSNQRMPLLLHAVDVVPVPLHDEPFARAQLPAKLIEAMAMAKSVIVSSVGDLPEIVSPNGRRSRGWVVLPGDARGLADAFAEIEDDQQQKLSRGQRAREFYLRNASVTANANAIAKLFHSQARLRPLIQDAERARTENHRSLRHGMSA